MQDNRFYFKKNRTVESFIICTFASQTIRLLQIAEIIKVKILMTIRYCTREV